MVFLSIAKLATAVTILLQVAPAAANCAYYCGPDYDPSNNYITETKSCCQGLGLDENAYGECSIPAGADGVRGEFLTCCEGNQLDICWPNGAANYGCGEEFPVECP
ncbi:hypothetical protein PSV09DRAFT_2029989 [Bipolaris maydis]|uniref:uncharacterized protein n=1 Tax=Cochliobolus heterostrophus TaxID=5016 RepID=UPI0024CF41D9|nr:hypothetical protein J3E73DRAFT_262432 [Bipolaris maydis]KAJ5028332.1 hypothetical protein J3E73DRAFT_254878 [Bipolaris maydis]KAJ6203494.1 hypothetical protein PSV09DRAFT_2029989 [Bipolaris maydis]KAJ6271757.1 hypothetical protein PSV08DRAFT_245921 [Bipolaris maydis]